jgi:hypothetical protein
MSEAEKLKLALAQLEEERERRIEAKVAEDRAIREPLVVVLGGPEDMDAKVEDARKARLAELRGAGEKREVVFDQTTIITGVPRSPKAYGESRPADGTPESDKPDYTSHLKTYEDTKIPPRPKPPAEALKPPEPGSITTQLRGPSEDGKDPGEVVSGWYDTKPLSG